MNDTNFERNLNAPYPATTSAVAIPVEIRKPEFVPAPGDAVYSHLALNLLNFYHHNPKLYKSHLNAVLMADKALGRKIADRAADRKETRQNEAWEIEFARAIVIIGALTWSFILGKALIDWLA